ncbi:MAG: pyridoxal phosphate-dependent aminotransferase [Phycisphaerales bacterium]|nr:pyridoxal phosphate-dependent aminotransferase [Phycisphaerales bacterium]
MPSSAIVPTMQLSDRATSIPPSITLAISAKVRELKADGREVIAFGAGEPDFDTPKIIMDAAITAMQNGETHYMPASGTPEAREAIAEKLQTENSIDCTANDISINAGAKMSINLALMALLDHGKGHEVVVPTPAWVSYEPMINLAGGTMVEVSSTPEDNFKCSPADISAAITPDTRAVLINSPSNPCGTMYSEDETRELADMFASHPHVAIISDEIYERLIYGDDIHLSFGAIPEIADRVVTINGLSKAFAMTGWRIGYACAPGNNSAVAKAMNTLQSQLNTCIASFCYAAIPVALNETADDVRSMRATFAARASLMHELISKWPDVTCPKPTGAFYAFPRVAEHFGKTTPAGRKVDDAVSFAEALLEETGVAVVPGTAFGGCGPEHIRLSFACSEDQIAEGVPRIGVWLETLSN